MKTVLRISIMIILVGGLGVVAVHAAETSDILSPTKRQEILDGAKKLLALREAPTVVADPFHSEAFADVIAAAGRVPGAVTPTGNTPAGPRTDHDLLQAISTSLKPSGYFVLGGQPTLVFGQKKVKAGSFLTITFEGTEYAVEITAIDRTNFTLRLNREEFTRPIK
jgi:hypothetical protein